MDKLILTNVYVGDVNDNRTVISEYDFKEYIQRIKNHERFILRDTTGCIVGQSLPDTMFNVKILKEDDFIFIYETALFDGFGQIHTYITKTLE